MSYDLYFYKAKNSDLNDLKLREYLNINLFKIPIEEYSWYYKNEYTKAYFNIEIELIDNSEDNIFEEYENFKELNLYFNLNYLRLEYFGKFAFDFVEKLIKDLDLFVMNPQSGKELPYKPTKSELFENWQLSNKQSTINYANEYSFIYCPLEKSNWFFEYNSQIPELEKTFNLICYVPRIMLMKEKSNYKIVSIVTWSMNIPNVFPRTDYVCLYKEKKKLFRTEKYIEIISFEMFQNEFKDYIISTNKENIVYIDKTKMTKDKFFNMKTLGRFDDVLERIEIEKITNYLIE